MAVDDDAILCAYSKYLTKFNKMPSETKRLCAFDSKAVLPLCIHVMRVENVENVFRGFNNNINSMLVLFHVKIFNKLYAAHICSSKYVYCLNGCHAMPCQWMFSCKYNNNIFCVSISCIAENVFGHIPHRNVSNGVIKFASTGVRKNKRKRQRERETERNIYLYIYNVHRKHLYKCIRAATQYIVRRKSK